jgi:hypothetical protein
MLRGNYRIILAHQVPPSATRGSRVVWTWRHLAAEAGTSKISEKGGGFQGCTRSLQAAVHPRCKPRALVAKKKKKKEQCTNNYIRNKIN